MMQPKPHLIQLAAMSGIVSLFVNLAIPKAGFYVGDVPITLGYALLGIAGALATLTTLLRRWTLPRNVKILLVALAPWSIAIAALLTFGERPAGVTYTATFFVSAVIIPYLAILTTALVVHHADRTLLRRVFLTALTIVTGWGLVHFIAMNLLGTFPGIPYVTVTGSELNVGNTRHIDRGGIFKMIATYNNGNILGVNALTWFPVAFALIGTESRWRPAFFGLPRLVFLFTLSRTVWIGWFVMEIVATLTAPRATRRVARLAGLVTLLATGVVITAATLRSNPWEFLFDRDLGGRIEQFQIDVTWFQANFVGIEEIVYTSILASFGLAGLALFLLTWSAPLALRKKGPVATAAVVGLVTYLVVMMSDGAFDLIPTQHTYWAIATIAVTWTDPPRDAP